MSVVKGTLARTAKKLPDGRILVEDVPMLAEERETDPRYLRERLFRNRLSGRRGPAAPRDEKWLQRCLAILRGRVQKGFKLPLTFRHSDDEPILAGEWVPRRIGPAEVNPGETPRATIFVDRLYKDEAAYHAAKRDFPYTSPEISPDYPDEVDALSHLGEAPYNKFALPELKELFRGAPFYRSRRGLVAQLWQGERLAEKFGSAREPYAVAQSMAKKGQIPTSRVGEVGDAIKEQNSTAVAGSALNARGLDGAQEKDRMGDKGVAVQPKVDAADEIQVASAGETASMTLDELGGKLDKLLDAHTKAHGELMACMKSYFEGKKAEAPVETMGAETGEVPGGTTEVAEVEADGLGKAQMHEKQGDRTEEEAGVPTADPAVYRTLKVLRTELARMRTARETDAKALAGLNGEVLGLRKAHDAVKAREAHQALVSSGRKYLTDRGIDLNDEDQKHLEKAAKLGKEGVDLFVSALASSAARAAELPAYGLVGAEERADLPEDMPEEVAQLIAKGGEDGRAAKELYRTWQGMNPKERAAVGGSLEGLLYDYDPLGNRVLATRRNGRG